MGCGRSRSSEEPTEVTAASSAGSDFKPDPVFSPSSQEWLKWVDNEREFDRQQELAAEERARIEQQEAQLAFVVPQAATRRDKVTVPPEVCSIDRLVGLVEYLRVLQLTDLDLGSTLFLVVPQVSAFVVQRTRTSKQRR